MNRINELFQNKKQNILSVYFTAGFPSLNDTSRVIKLLEKYGADMIEVGIPFSDPVADGEIIQKSSQKALKNGMNLDLLFDQLANIRESVSLPIILMGYFNPIYKMGIDRFLGNCHTTGIDGVIIPDFPPEEYIGEIKDSFENNNIFNILLITPQTNNSRIIQLDSISRGFIYMVSSYSTTGSRQSFNNEQIKYFNRVKELNLINPLITGFGISDFESYSTACKYSNGAITGSAFVKALNGDGTMEYKIQEFMKGFRRLPSV